MSESIVVVGGINLDTLARVDGTLTRGSSNPGQTTSSPGGVGRNIAENLARLGSPVRLVGAVGRDRAGNLLLEQLNELGVDTAGVARRIDVSTGTYTAVLGPDGDLDVGVADMAATESVSPADLPDDLLDDAGWLVIDGNLRADTIERALARARDKNVPVALDPVSVAKAARLGSLKGVHTFSPNAAELTAWAGTDEDRAVAKAHADGVAVLWLRAGSDGSRLLRPGQPEVAVKLPPAEVVDVTGAGDAMLAAYVHRLRSGDPTPEQIEDAVWFATAAAWLTVGSASAVREDLTESLVEKTLQEKQ